MGWVGGSRSMTNDMKRRLLYAIDHGMPITRATDYAGIHYKTWRDWVIEAERVLELGESNQYSEIYMAVREHQAAFAMGAMDKISMHADRHWAAAAWQLEKLFPRDFGARQQVEVVQGQPQISIEDERLRSLTTEELLVLQNALNKLSAGANVEETEHGKRQSAGLESGRTVDVVPTESWSDPPAASRNGTTLG